MDYKQFVLEVEVLMLSMNPFVFPYPSTTTAQCQKQSSLSSVLRSLRNVTMTCRSDLTEMGMSESASMHYCSSGHMKDGYLAESSNTSLRLSFRAGIATFWLCRGFGQGKITMLSSEKWAHNRITLLLMLPQLCLPIKIWDRICLSEMEGMWCSGLDMGQSQKTWVQSLSLPLISWVILGKSFHLSVLLFPLPPCVAYLDHSSLRAYNVFAH